MAFQSKGKKPSKKKGFSKIFVFLFLALILIFPGPSYEGAKRGLLLWFNTVLPTLLPFIIASNLVVRLQITKILSKFLYPVFRFIFHVSPGGCYPVLIGLLSGIPVGAKATGDLVKNNEISTDEGQYIISFCNNASPMFIMSFIAISQLEQPGLRIQLLLINFISAFLAATVYFKILKLPKKQRSRMRRSLSIQEMPVNMEHQDGKLKFDFAMLDNAIMDGFEVITKVGGYIILFSIPAEIISKVNLFDSYLKLITIGLLEITTGINSISRTGLDLNTKIVLIASITAFGGLSGLAQTRSVINNSRLSIGTYFKSKLLHMLFAYLLATAFVTLYL